MERHIFWIEDRPLLDERWVPFRFIRTHLQITDARLPALALNRGGRLASFDRGISRLVPNTVDPVRALELIPFETS